MKAIKYIFITLGVLIVFVLAAAVIIPIVYKDKIVELGKAEANKRINATLDFDNDIDLSIFRSFPNISVGVNNLKIVNKAPFEGDTLVYLPEFTATLDIMSVIKGDRIQVKSVSLEEPFIQLLVLRDGTANWDIAIADEDSMAAAGVDTASNFSMGLRRYELKNATIIYNDSSTAFYVRTDGMDHSGNGDFTEDVFDLDTKTLIDGLTLGYDGVNYLENVETELDAKLNINMPESKYSFKENELRLNALHLGFDGYVAMPTDDIETDLSFKARETSFKSILSLIPAIYTQDFGDLEASGTMALAGMVKGIYNETSYPGFNIDLDIENGMFKYPDLPSAVTDVFVDANIKNPGGDLDNMIISVPKAHFAMAGEPFDATLLMNHPMTDPYVDATLRGRIMLGKFNEIMKLEEGTKLTGTLIADLQMKGSLSAVETEQYDKFYAAGYIAGNDIAYTASDMPQPVNVQAVRLDFNPRSAELTNFDMTSGESDLRAQGSISNYLGYVMKDQTLKGNLSIYSNYFNVNPWMAEDNGSGETTSSESEPMSAVELPANIDFAMNADMKRVEYDDMDITNLKGLLVLREQRFTLENVSMNLLGGSFVATGYYDSKNPVQPETQMKLGIREVSIPETFNTFTSVQQFVPIAKYMSGNMSADLSFDTKLDKEMNPVWSTFNSVGKLNIKRAEIADFTALNEIGSKLNMPEFKNIVLTDIRPSYKIVDGRFFLNEPVKFKVGNIAAQVTGSNGIDKTLDYVMATEIPAGHLQSAASQALSQIIKTEEIDLSAAKTVKLNVLIGGTIDDPKITVSFKEFTKTLTESVKEQVIDLGKEKLDEAKQKARAEADRILKEAEKQAAQIREAARQAADKAKQEGYNAAARLEAEAKNPVAKAAAKLAADKARKEADEAAQRIVSEGDRKAQQVIDAARKKADELLK